MDGRTYMHVSSGRRVRVSDQGAGSRERTLWSVFATERLLRTDWKLCSSSITAWVEMDGWMDGWMVTSRVASWPTHVRPAAAAGHRLRRCCRHDS